MIKPRTKTATLDFKRSELLYDCTNLGYVEGDVMSTQDEHDKHQVMDICEDGNVDRVTRIIGLTIAKCVELCFPYTKNPAAQDATLDDTLTEKDVYHIHLLLPDDFSNTTLDLLEHLIHELIVDRVMEDWTSITKPESTGNWSVKAEKLEMEIRTSLNSRCGRTRRKLRPF